MAIVTNSRSLTATPCRFSLACYKDQFADPANDPFLKTIFWNEPIADYPVIRRVGADFERGGDGLKNDSGWDGDKFIKPQSPLPEGTRRVLNEILPCPGIEYAGVPILEWDASWYPVADLEAMDVDRARLSDLTKDIE